MKTSWRKSGCHRGAFVMDDYHVEEALAPGQQWRVTLTWPRQSGSFGSTKELFDQSCGAAALDRAASGIRQAHRKCQQVRRLQGLAVAFGEE